MKKAEFSDVFKSGNLKMEQKFLTTDFSKIYPSRPGFLRSPGEAFIVMSSDIKKLIEVKIDAELRNFDILLRAWTDEKYISDPKFSEYQKLLVEFIIFKLIKQRHICVDLTGKMMYKYRI